MFLQDNDDCNTEKTELQSRQRTDTNTGDHITKKPLATCIIVKQQLKSGVLGTSTMLTETFKPSALRLTKNSNSNPTNGTVFVPQV